MLYILRRRTTRLRSSLSFSAPISRRRWRFFSYFCCVIDSARGRLCVELCSRVSGDGAALAYSSFPFGEGACRSGSVCGMTVARRLRPSLLRSTDSGCYYSTEAGTLSKDSFIFWSIATWFPPYAGSACGTGVWCAREEIRLHESETILLRRCIPF